MRWTISPDSRTTGDAGGRERRAREKHVRGREARNERTRPTRATTERATTGAAARYARERRQVAHCRGKSPTPVDNPNRLTHR